MRRTLALIDQFQSFQNMKIAKSSTARPAKDGMPRCWREETKISLKGLKFPTQPSALQVDIPSRYDFILRTPTIASEVFDTEALQGFVIYYHGGGLKVGDLDSEDFSC